MKSRNLAQIFVLILSLALIIGAVFGISAVAEEAEIVDGDIKATSIIHGDKIQISIRVAAENAENVEVRYTWAGENAKTAAYVCDNGDGTHTYATEGVAAYDIGKVAHIASYVNGEVVEEGDYSVAHFLYAMLYRDGIISSEEEADIAAADCYKALLAYGAASQTHLSAGPALPVDGLVCVYTTYNGSEATITVNGDSTYYFDANATTATITPAAISIVDGWGLLGWTVTSPDGTVKEYESDAEIVVSGTVDLCPVLAECEHEDNNGDHKCDTCHKTVSSCVDENADSLCDVCRLYTFQYDVTSGVSLYTFTSTGNANPANQTSITTTSTSTGYYGALGSLANDPTGAANQVLKLVINGGVNNSNTSGAATYPSRIKFAPTSIAEGGNIHVFEYDFYAERFNKANSRNFLELYAYDSEGNSGRLQNGGTDGSTNGHTKAITAVTGSEVVKNCFQVGVGSTQTEGANYANFDSHTWYRFRFVYDATNGMITACVSFDGGENWYLAAKQASTTSLTTAGVDPAKIEYLAFGLHTYGHGEIFYVDNVNYYVTDSITLPTESGIDAVEHPSAE